MENSQEIRKFPRQNKILWSFHVEMNKTYDY